MVVEDRVRHDVEDRAVARGVLGGAGLRRREEVRAVGVDDARPRVEAGEADRGEVLGGGGDVGVAAGARDPVDRRLDDHRCRHGYEPTGATGPASRGLGVGTMPP
jgi:hypothetical protein